MALEAVQAQAGHRSIESTRIYLHLANDWLAGEYRRSRRGDRRASPGRAVMPAPLSLADGQRSAVEDYLAARRAAGRKTGRSTTRAAHTCQAKIDRAGGWAGLNRPQQIDAVAKAPSFTSWLMVTGRITVDAELLTAPICGPDCRPGRLRRRLPLVQRNLSASVFLQRISRRSGTSWPRSPRSPACLRARHRRTFRRRPRRDDHRLRPPRQAHRGQNVAAVFHRLRLTLSTRSDLHAAPANGETPGFGHRMGNHSTGIRRDRAAIPQTGRAQFAAKHGEAHQPRSAPVRHLAGRHPPRRHELRRPAARTHRGVQDVADHPPQASSQQPLNRVSIKDALINLHCFLTRSPNGATRTRRKTLMFPGDLPIVDKPLPRFLDDAAAAKLLRATRSDADPLSRLIVELLARTGIRRGELLALTVDAVVQIGSAYWLRIPIGKLHNDRYIPLHPQLKELLDDWITHHRPNGLRTNHLLIEHKRPISRQRVTAALRRVADVAGIGNVTAHQLRHTLATQAVNRGMSLDAIAALLGHKTLAMTMVYARIADKTVAEEYFAVTEKVEALYGQPAQLASDEEGREMRKLRTEMHRRMLGNGYCARPVEMDCHFESICESCSFFVTTIEFRPTLQRQRDDAASKGQIGRQKIFDGILNRLDTTAS